MTQTLTKSGTPRKRAPGAGRPPLAERGIKIFPTVYQRHLALIAQWQQAHGVSASEAVRQMIVKASK